MFIRRSLLAILSLVLAFSAIALAQQPKAPAPDNEGANREGRRHGRHEGMGRHRPGLLALRELNLNDEQRQQVRAAMQRQLESTKSQREELFKLREKRMAGTLTSEDEARAMALHQELRDSMKGVEGEIEGILTPEQRTSLEQIRKERSARHEERLKNRRESPN
jgi:Spy/CpxP family protein refolding chaperone